MSRADEEVMNGVRITSAAWAGVRSIWVNDVPVAVEPWAVVGTELSEESPRTAGQLLLGRVDHRWSAAQDCVRVGRCVRADDGGVDVLQGGLGAASSCAKKVPSFGCVSGEEVRFHAASRLGTEIEMVAGMSRML